MLTADSYLLVRHSFLYCWQEFGRRSERRVFAAEPQGFGNRFQGLRLCLT